MGRLKNHGVTRSVVEEEGGAQISLVHIKTYGVMFSFLNNITDNS